MSVQTRAKTAARSASQAVELAVKRAHYAMQSAAPTRLYAPLPSNAPTRLKELQIEDQQAIRQTISRMLAALTNVANAAASASAAAEQATAASSAKSAKPYTAAAIRAAKRAWREQAHIANYQEIISCLSWTYHD